jgi:large subunit ribosomal protein L24
MATIVRFHVKRGDTVQVISGNHRGATGKVMQILPKKQQVLIEGVRMIKKHTKRSQDAPQGAIIEREGPIHISNVKLAEAAEKGKTEKPKAAKSQKPAPEKPAPEKPKAEKPAAAKPKASKPKSEPKSKPGKKAA